MGDKETLSELLEAPDNDNSDLRLSFSRVSSFLQNGPSSLLKRKYVSNDGIKMGKLIDLLLFERIRFNDEYIVGTMVKPTGMAGTLADRVLEECTAEYIIANITLNDTVFVLQEEIVNLATRLSEGLWVSTKDPDKRHDKINTVPFWDYLLATAEAEGKESISPDELDMAELNVAALRTHAHTKDIFKDNIGTYYQFEANFEYRGFNFLGYLDIVQVDHTNKTFCVKDLKTGKKNENFFLSSVLAFNYYLQAKLYQIAAVSIMKTLQIEDYTLLPFEFVYICRFDKIPAVYSVSDKWEQAATSGFTTDRGITFPGLDETLDLIRWHWDNKVFDCSKETYEANGQKQLNDNFITVTE